MKWEDMSPRERREWAKPKPWKNDHRTRRAPWLWRERDEVWRWSWKRAAAWNVLAFLGRLAALGVVAGLIYLAVKYRVWP